MAYLNYLPSVSWTEVEKLRSGANTSVRPNSVAAVSHLLATGVKERLLGKCLRRVLDHGEVLASSFWHPLRVPIVSPPCLVTILAGDLRAALDALTADLKSLYAKDYEITEILRVLDDAAQNNRAVVSVLEPPADQERAQRVACPFDEPEKLPNFPWGNLARVTKHLPRRS